MRIVLAVTLCLLSFVSYANKEQEIQHLLDYVEKTDCTYERNGDKHTGKEAVGHIKKKYDYYFDDVETAEDFIKLSATKSTMSGRKYKVHCKGKSTIDSQTWLLLELQRYRRSQSN
jgi:hypothetical protein